MAQQDPTLMNATPSKKALLDSLNTQVKAQTSNKYGYSPYQAVGRLPAQEQDAILGDMANQITYKGGISVSANDLKGLPAFNNTVTISARKPSFLEGLADIGANLGEGIIQGVTGRTTDYYGDTLHDKFGILGSPNNEWVRNITAIPTGLGVGAGLTLVNPLLGAGWFGATSANQAIEANQQASQEAGAIGDFNQSQKIKDLQGQSAGIAGTAGALTSFLPAYLGKGLAKKALTGAGLGYAQDYATRKALDYATTGTADASLVAPEMGTLFGAGFPLAGAGLKKLAGKRAKITEAPSQKQAVEALQNEANNAPLASQRNRARATLGRMNTQYLKQPLQTTAKPASKPFKASLEAPQSVKKPVVVVPVKKKIKPPLQLPTKVVGGFKKKVTPAEVAKPANVEAPTTKESLTVEPKPQETAVKAKVVEPTPAKMQSKPPEIEGLKNGDKAPSKRDSESFDDYRARLEKQLPDGWGLRKASLDAGVVSLYEKTSKKRASAEGQADIEKVIGKPLDEASYDDLLKASKVFRDKAQTDPSPETTKANELIKKKANDAILEADAKGEDTSKLREIEANAITGLDTLTEQGQIISVKDAPTAFEEGIKNLKENGNIDVAKVKAETKAVIDSIDDASLSPSKAINKGSRDIDTQLQDLKASQGTQPQTPDDIRRGAGVLMGHDSFLAKETLEALGYPLKYKKFSGDANSTGWSVQIGGKKIELHPNDSLGGLLRRNKLEGAFEAGLVKRKAGDVVKGLIDDLDPNDLTLNETELKQKLTAYREGLPKDGGLLTSREAEAFTLLDNAKTPDELNAVEVYVSERENDYQEGFHEEFYKHWDDRHKALEGDYQGKVDNRVAKADETRQLKATEQVKQLKKELATHEKKIEKLSNELIKARAEQALVDPIARAEKSFEADVIKNPSAVVKELKAGLKSGKLTPDDVNALAGKLTPYAKELLAKASKCKGR